ncbi:MAG: acyltransferase [Porticoccus sp.]
MEIGNDFFAGPDFYLSTSRYSKVSIGDAVMFGPSVMILGGNHDYSYSKAHMRFNQEEDKKAKDIVIDSGSWVGAGSVVLSGASVGEGAVIGACSVVNKEVPPYCVAVGNRFRVIGPRFESISELEACLENTLSSYSIKDILGIYEQCGFILK